MNLRFIIVWLFLYDLLSKFFIDLLNFNLLCINCFIFLLWDSLFDTLSQ